MLENDKKNILEYCISLKTEIQKTVEIYKNSNLFNENIETLKKENEYLKAQLKKVKEELLSIKNELENDRNSYK